MLHEKNFIYHELNIYKCIQLGQRYLLEITFLKIVMIIIIYS